MNFIKIGKTIINLDQVEDIHDNRNGAEDTPGVYLRLANSRLQRIVTGTEADNLMAFLEDAATDVAAWAEVVAEDDPCLFCAYEGCDQEPIPGEGLCQGHWDQEEAEMIYQAAIALHHAGKCGEGCQLCKAQATSTAEAYPARRTLRSPSGEEVPF